MCGKESCVKEGPDARAAPLEGFNVKRRVKPPARVAARVVSECLRILFPLLAGLAQREMQLRVARSGPVFIGEHMLHGRDLGITEGIVLQISKTPVGLGVGVIDCDGSFVGGRALGTVAQGFVDMADRGAQSHFLRLQLRRPLVGRERFLLPEQPRRDCGGGDPALRIFRLDGPEVARRGLRFRQAPERQQRGSEPAPGEWQVRGLSQRMTQQPFGIEWYVRGERYRCKPAQRRHVAGIHLQDLAKQRLCALAVIGEQRRGRRVDPRPFGVALPGALEGGARVGVLLEIYERVAVGQPGQRVMRLPLEHPTHLIACFGNATSAAVGTRQIDAGTLEFRCAAKHSFERDDALGALAPIEERHTEQPAAVQVGWRLGVQCTQPVFGSLRTSGTQRRICRAQSLLERGFGSRQSHRFLAIRPALSLAEHIAVAQPYGARATHRDGFVELRVVCVQLRPGVGQVLAVHLHKPTVLANADR